MDPVHNNLLATTGDNVSPALEACHSLNQSAGTDGYTDWRLPTLLELKSIMSCDACAPNDTNAPNPPLAIGDSCLENNGDNNGAACVEPDAFPDASTTRVWSATLQEGDDVWVGKFAVGGHGSFDMAGFDFPVRCVRGPYLTDCGNGFVEPGEACDDGNDDNDDVCTNSCEAVN